MDVVLISLLCSAAGTVIAAVGLMRYFKKDTIDKTGTAVRLESKVDYVSKGVDDIRLDIKDQGRRMDDITQRVTRVEESTKSAHHRIDELISKEGS